MGTSRATLAVLVGLTSLHAAYRVQSSSLRGEGISVSELSVGDTVPEFVVTLFRGGEERVPGDDCTLVVVFDPACPHCRRAAERERRRVDPIPFRLLWVSENTSDAALRYVDLVHPDSRVGSSRRVSELLSIHAVPAALLVDRKGELQRIGVYRGNEGWAEPQSACARSDQ
jgi:protein-disulfide isomerase